MCGFKNTIHFLMLSAIVTTCLLTTSSVNADFQGEMPVFFKGRYRPIDAYSKLWLYDIYHKQSLKKEDEIAGSQSANDLVWSIAFNGSQQLENTRLFWIHYAGVKQKLGLDLKRDRFSYNEIFQSINPAFLEDLVTYYYQQSGKSAKIEINQLSPDLWVSKSIIVKTPQSGIFSQLKQGSKLKTHSFNKPEIEESVGLLSQLQQFKHLKGTILKVIPSKKGGGDWLPIDVLSRDETNPSLYSNELYTKLKVAFRDRNIPLLDSLLMQGYSTIAGTVYQEAKEKSLSYPSLGQLKIESFYYQYSLIEITLLLYAIGLLLYFFGYFKSSLVSISIAFGLHTCLLLMRWYILGRPPVSNMFETVMYVPWIAVLIGFVFTGVFRSELILASASFVAMALLLVLKVTDISSSMENVQAVLDSQYWLIIHVLLVVGSYGLFALAGVLGQIYLILTLKNPTETARMKQIAQATLQAMYIGVAMLIPGTILGGVWAAESWGRFWDWDPKESWAFISSCVYLIFIHAYTFRHVGNFGLAMGAVIGLLAISFTWYGVNYILGTGLHSYGFGTGGELIYYSFIVLEILFLAFVGLRNRPQHQKV